MAKTHTRSLKKIGKFDDVHMSWRTIFSTIMNLQLENSTAKKTIELESELLKTIYLESELPTRPSWPKLTIIFF